MIVQPGQNLLLLGLAVLLLAVGSNEEFPGDEISQELRLISAVSQDWMGKPADEVIAACGKPTKIVTSKNGETQLIYRIPLQHGWTVSGVSPALHDAHDNVASEAYGDDSPTFEPVTLSGTATVQPAIVGKLKVVFFVDTDDSVRDVSVEQKLKKKYR